MLVCGLRFTPLPAQTSTPLDSLIAANNAYGKEDSVKVKMLIQIAGEYQKSDPKKGVKAAEEAIAIGRRNGNPLLLAEACNKMGANLSGTGAPQEAIPYFEEARSLFERQGEKKSAAAMLGNLGVMYSFLANHEKALGYFEKSLQLAETLGDLPQKAKIFGNLGATNLVLNDFPKAISYLDQAISAQTSLNNTKALGTVYSNKGIAYYNLGDYPNALESYQKALTIAQKTGKAISEAHALTNISVAYYHLKDYPKALEYQQKALVIHEKSGNKTDIARDYINFSSRYRAMNNHTAALESLQKALALLMETKDPNSLFACYSNFGDLYEKLFDLNKALEYRQKAIDIAEKQEDVLSIASEINKTAQIYWQAPDSVLVLAGIPPSSRYQVAEEKFLLGRQLAEKIGAKAIMASIWNNLSSLYEHTGNYPKAYEAYKKYIVLNDSMLGEDTKKQITRKEIQFEFDKKEATLKLEQQLTLEQLEQQKLLSLQQQQNLQINQQALALSNKEKDLQRLAYLQEKAEKQEKEQQLLLTQKDKQLQDIQLGALLQEKALQLKTLAEKNALIGFLIAGILAVLLAFAAFYSWIRQRQAKKEAAVQAQFTRQLLEHVEDDRGRIAIDLHDSVSHDLLLLKQSIRKELAGPEVGDKIDGIINGIRQISRNLHPVMLDKIGLRLSLETLCEQFMLHETMFVSHEIDYQNTLPKTAELQLFRIVQEGLTNALKYSKAEAVKVRIQYAGKALRLEIQDNGKGFDVEKALEGGKAFGLHSILQRAKAIGGKADIRSGESGTTIGVVVG